MGDKITMQSGHEFQEIHNLVRAIKWANQQGMIFEFVDFFLSDYNENGGDVYEAINYANREWDL